ncbi:hypothetical protein CERZMDRAFT_37444 [Cercospora zeae-maydis SCOH1-5]|uniref:Acyltransferase 3 domain-containing protein n=1 Tax=Cercospora zeae-maydis SCOH1-5 TaxID=717836 RepID=A0A6A6FLX5_9PEZI|nr:hypothetical protein CERZMDRAFT_37444 [Cercospora zeae-maydis SCOH1-5]
MSHGPAESSKSSSTRHLDGLRGLAAIIVFIQHNLSNFTFGLHDFGFGQSGAHYNFVSLPFVRIFFNGGGAAVVIFFILSGYVLSVSSLRKLKSCSPSTSANDIRAFRWSLVSAVVRRPVRLYLPPLVIAFMVALTIHIPGPLFLPSGVLKPQEGGIVAELMHLIVKSAAFFQPFQVHSNHFFKWYTYDMAIWTIPIELKGSILVFGLLGLLSLFGLRGAGPKQAAVIAASMIGIGAIMLNLAFKWSMACFLFGMAIAIVDVWDLDGRIFRALPSERIPSIALHILFFGGWYLLSEPAHDGNPFTTYQTPGWMWLSTFIPQGYNQDNFYRYWHSLGGLPFVYGTLRISWLRWLLSRKPMLFLGEVSFMLYLVHLPLGEIFGVRINSILGGHVPEQLQGTFWDGSLAIPDIGPFGMSTRPVACLSISLLIYLFYAYYATEWIDKPAVRLSRKMAVKLRLQPDRISVQEPLLPMATVDSLQPIGRGVA